MNNLRKLRAKNQARVQKLQIPLQNQLMKIIRQSEVYLMEEAVTHQIVLTTQPKQEKLLVAESGN